MDIDCFFFLYLQFSVHVAHQNFLEFIVTNSHAFTLREEPAFKKFTSSLQPLYKPLGASALKDRLMRTYVKARHQVIQLSFNENHKVALTTDLWTSPNKLPFRGITTSIWTDKFDPLNVIIGFKHMFGDHSGLNIAENFFEVVRFYKFHDEASRK